MGGLPHWTARLRFAEQFGISPAEVGKLPAQWWYRWTLWENAKASRAARENVERYGLNKVSKAEQELYNELVVSQWRKSKS